MTTPAPLIDPFGRRIQYLRVSVTDRCDLRCTYCMAEHMTFLPRRDLLTLEELDRLIAQFVALGVRKIRMTGGEPLVRRGVMDLITAQKRHLDHGDVDEVTLTTNGTQLARYADDLVQAGVRRINVSIDTINHQTYRELTRGGDLCQTLTGVEAAKAAGLNVKINAVALRHHAGDIIPLIEWAHTEGFDVTLIETMPMGDVGEDRVDQYLPLTQVKETLGEWWTLTPLPLKTGGPARYMTVEETGGRLGFISPLTGNFCDGCNRVRLTCTGKLYQCLGQDNSVDFRELMRRGATGLEVRDAIQEAIAHKPFGHDFVIQRNGTPSLSRHMSVTGG